MTANLYKRINDFLLSNQTGSWSLVTGANPEKVQGGAHAMDVWGFGGGAGHSP